MICTDCKRDQPASEFYPKNKKRCKKCVIKRTAIYNKENQQRISKQSKTRYLSRKNGHVEPEYNKFVSNERQIEKLMEDRGMKCESCEHREITNLHFVISNGKPTYVVAPEGKCTKSYKKKIEKCNLLCVCCIRSREKLIGKLSSKYKKREVEELVSKKKAEIGVCENVACDKSMRTSTESFLFDLCSEIREENGPHGVVLETTRDVGKVIDRCHLLCANCSSLNKIKIINYKEK